MKKLLFLVFLIGCAPVERNDNKSQTWRDSVDVAEKSWEYTSRCEPLYKIAQTHTDTMIVHAMIPNTHYSGPTCYQYWVRWAEK